MEHFFNFRISRDTFDVLTVLVFMIIFLYYTYLVGSVMDKRERRKPTKKQFLLGLIPFFMWGALFLESFSELD